MLKKKQTYIVFTVIGVLLVSLGYCHWASASSRQDYKLVWQEDFNGTRLDTTKWSIIPRKPWQPFWFMSSNKSLFNLSSGRLRLYCRRNDGIEPNDTAKWLCGGIWTKDKFTVRYGKVEVRARICGVQGSWPAIWMLNYEPKNTWGTKTYTEIDLMESINRDKTAHQTVHNYCVDLAKGLPHSAYHVEADIDYRKYNVYSVEILPDKVVLGINGKTTLTYEKKEGMEGQFPYGLPQILLLDMQYGGTSWVGKVDPAQLPAYMDIDWVKVYKLSGEK